MFRDCFRCGSGWYDPLGVATLCICTGMTDEQAGFVKSLHENATQLRKIARHALNDPEKLSKDDLHAIGILV